jgi:hypothetical protein
LRLGGERLLVDIAADALLREGQAHERKTPGESQRRHSGDAGAAEQGSEREARRCLPLT